MSTEEERDPCPGCKGERTPSGQTIYPWTYHDPDCKNYTPGLSPPEPEQVWWEIRMLVKRSARRCTVTSRYVCAPTARLARLKLAMDSRWRGLDTRIGSASRLNPNRILDGWSSDYGKETLDNFSEMTIERILALHALGEWLSEDSIGARG